MANAADYGFAIVNADGVITELVEDREDAEGRWGHTRELVQLTRSHHVGDEIEWNAKGVEVTP